MSTDSQFEDEHKSESAPYSLWSLTAYFFQLGTIGFGGPVALIGYMHRDLVERRKWISETDYREGLASRNSRPARSQPSCRFIWATFTTELPELR